VSNLGLMRVLTLCFALAGCEPTFDRPSTLIDRPSILAVQAEPAEAAPGDFVMLRAAAAGGDGPMDRALHWSFCTMPRPIAENTPVAQDCLEASAPWIVPIAEAATGPVSAQLPADACANFGPEPPPPPPGEDPLRPADPDSTGGYYQPVRVVSEVPELIAFGRIRLLCALPSAPADVVREFRERYQPNDNPGIGDLVVVDASASEVRLRVTWPAEDAEPFVVHDPRESVLRDVTESLRVSWFSTAGTFASDRTSPAGGEPSADNTFFPPNSPQGIHVWAVLRDSRGGMDWRSFEVSGGNQ